MLQVQLFGRFSLLCPDREIFFPTSKVRLLAAYLFWCCGKWVRRDVLFEMLWGNDRKVCSSNNLRTAIHIMKKTLECYPLAMDILEIRRDAIRIVAKPQVSIDVYKFEEKLSVANSDSQDISLLNAALSIYRGEFLEGMDSEWCVIERQRLSDLYINALVKVVNHMFSCGMYECGVIYSRYWVEANPLDERVHQLLMQLYSKLGRFDFVAKQYEYCKKVFKHELNISPSQSTVNLYSTLLQSAGIKNGTPLQKKPTLSTIQEDYSIHQIGNHSKDPVLKARMLLANGQVLSMNGDTSKGLEIMHSALDLYIKHGSAEEQAQARMIISKVLYTFTQRTEAIQILECLNPALKYFQKQNDSPNLLGALLLASNANWAAGRISESIFYAHEGMNISQKLDIHEQEIQISLQLAIGLRDSYCFEEAKFIFDSLAAKVASVTDLELVFRILQNRAIFDFYCGDFIRAGNYFHESYEILSLIDSFSPRTKEDKFVTLSFLIQNLKYTDKTDELDSYRLPVDTGSYSVKPFAYFNALYSHNTNKSNILLEFSNWAKGKLNTHTWAITGPLIRILIEQLIMYGMQAEALKWTAVGVRLSHKYKHCVSLSLFYVYRAMLLTVHRRMESAEKCLTQARSHVNSLDKYTQAWILFVQGLKCGIQGDDVLSKQYLGKSIRLLKKTGNLYMARYVENAPCLWQSPPNESENRNIGMEKHWQVQRVKEQWII